MNYTIYRFLLFVFVILPWVSYSSADGISGDSLQLSMSHSRNFYNSGFYLELKVNHPEAVVKFTMDCSTPTIQNGKEYQSPVFIDSTCVIKAFAFHSTDTSVVSTHTFIFPESLARQGKAPVGFPLVWGGSTSIGADYEMDKEVIMNPVYTGELELALKSLPVVSLSMSIDDWFNPETGLYIGYPNSDVSHEKAVTAEFIYADSVKNFEVNCGVQNQGGTSIIDWKVPKQSMRLLFKEKYGPKKLKKKLFPDAEIESINTLVLDGFLYSWLHPWDEKQRITTLYFRDQLASDMQNSMGWHSFHGVYVHLFINGLYWGMYDLHERPDEDFLAEYLHAETEDFDVIKHNQNTVVSGSNASYKALLSLARKGVTTAESLDEVSKLLDIPAFIDYMILNFYLGNFDWAHQNYYAAVNRTAQSGFRFYTWDAEHVMRYSELSYNNVTKNDKGGPTEIHAFLRSNAEYRMMFADAVYRHFYNDGVLTPERFRDRFLYRKNEIDKAVILESARWGDFLESTTNTTFTRDDHWLPEVFRVLSEYIPLRRDVVLRQLQADAGLYPAIVPPAFSVFAQPEKNSATVEIRNTNMAGGTIYYTVDGSDPRAVGGSVNGARYTQKIEVQHGTLIKARVFNETNKVWSALAEKAVLVRGVYGDAVVISEIMYHPAEGYPEFVELTNTGNIPVILDGFRFTKGIYFDFDKGTVLQPNAAIVVTNDTTLFSEKYGFAAAGQFARKLDNAGETLKLQNRDKQLVDSIPYSDTIPWPVLADGDGFSIELADVKSDNSLAVNWKTSAEKNGSPSPQVNLLAAKGVIYPNPFTAKVFVELENPGANAKYSVMIYNLMGSVVKSGQYSAQHKLEIETADLPAGVYIFNISQPGADENEILRLKAVKTGR